MNDLEKAKKIYKSENHTCVLCKDDMIYTSDLKGIAPMVNFIEQNTDLNGFSAADKIVGKAATMLFISAGVTSVYADVMSKTAVSIFSEHGVNYSYDTLTENIINRTGDGLCPMEQAVSNISDISQVFSIIKNTLEKLRQNNMEAKK
jgi:predicted transcriptional regulator